MSSHDDHLDRFLAQMGEEAIQVAESLDPEHVRQPRQHRSNRRSLAVASVFAMVMILVISALIGSI